MTLLVSFHQPETAPLHGEMRHSMSPVLRGSDGGSENCTTAPAPDDPNKEASRETTSKRLSFGIDQILDRKTSSRKSDSLILWKDCQSNVKCLPARESEDKRRKEDRLDAPCNWQAQKVLSTSTYNSESSDSLHQTSYKSNPSLSMPNPFCTQLRLPSTSVESGSFCSTSLTSGVLLSRSLSSSHLNSYALDVITRLRSEGSRPVWGPGVQGVDNFEYRAAGGHHSLLEHPLFSWPGAQRDRFGGELSVLVDS